MVDTVAVAGAAAVGISSSGLSTPGAMPRGMRTSFDPGFSGPLGSSAALFPTTTSTSFTTAMSSNSNSSLYAAASNINRISGGGASTPPKSTINATTNTTTDGSGGGTTTAASTSIPGSPLHQKHHHHQQTNHPSLILSPAVSLTPEPVAPPPSRTALTRPEVALCLLSEVACEQDEELRPHLPALLHVAVLHADSTNPFVRQEACQILQYLLYSLACKPLEAQGHASGAGGGGGGGGGLTGVGSNISNNNGVNGSGGGDNYASSDYARVAGVIGYLQSLNNEAVWAWELPTLAQPWVTSAGYVAAFVQLGKVHS